jgi:ubiquinone/menaquinone biosynthesis C-methylase UbiE
MKGTDIYLIDQILKGRYDQIGRILDAGCGKGRNMLWFAQNDFEIYGSDLDNESLILAEEYTGLSSEQFKWAPIENMPYENAYFDHLICNAVLHFARSEAHFMEMVKDLFRVLKPGGSLFIRMTSNLGLPDNYQPLGNGRYYLKDESERFLLTAKLLEKMKSTFPFEYLEPVKSVLVEDLRSMTTLVLEKKASG